MTWVCIPSTCSPGLEEESSQINCLDTLQSALLKSKNIHEEFYCRDNLTEFYQHFQFGTILSHSDKTTQNVQISLEEQRRCQRNSPSAAGSRNYAPILAQQEKEQESKDQNQDSGQRWPESFAKYDPNMHSWKTRQCLLFGGLDEFSQTWPSWGTMQGGESFGHQILGQDITVPDAFWWPTPTTKSGGGNCGGTGDYHKALKLGVYVPRLTNPNLYEWLMGWPIGWTGLMPVEWAKFQSWLQAHGEYYHKE